MAENTTNKIKLDISELKAAMQDANRQLKLVNAEFKATSASMEDWTTSADGVQAKLKQLNSAQEIHIKKLEILKQQYELVANEQGESSKEAQNLLIKIKNQEAVVNKTSVEIGKFTKKLDELENAADDTEKSFKDLEKSAKDTGEGFTVFKGIVANLGAKVITSLANGLKSLGNSILSTAENTRQYRNEINKLNTAAQESGINTDYVKNKYKDLYGVLADETATSTTLSNFIAMGTSQEILNSLLNSSIGIWAKYGDSIPLDGLSESINETSRVAKVTGTLADALNWAGINEDEFNKKLAQCTTEQERQNLIAETLDSTYGNLSKAYQENNKNVIEANKANAEYTEKMSEIGEKVEPIVTTLKIKFADLLSKTIELFTGANTEDFANSLSVAFDDFINNMLPVVISGFQWILDNKEPLLSAILGIAGGFVAFKIASVISTLVGLMQTLFMTIQTGTGIMGALNAVMSSNPIVLVISLIAGLVTAFITLWNTSESFRNFWIGIWNSVTGTVSNGVNAVISWFSSMGSSISSAVGFGISKIQDFANSVWSTLSSLPSRMYSIGSDIVSGIWNGISGGATWLFDKIKGFASGIVNKFKGFLGIKSPSRVFKAEAKWIPAGIGVGLTENENLAIKPLNKMLEKLKSKAKNLNSGLFSFETKSRLENSVNNIIPFVKQKSSLVSEKISEVKNITFNQYNNSPKSLSRLDIYRQTNSLLFSAKRRVQNV